MDPTAAEPAEVPHEAAAAGKSTPTAVDESPAKAFWNFLVAFGKFLRRNGKRLRVWNQRGGAGASGLATLVETHALQSAGDATITVALAGSLFFSVSTDAARSRIGLYLLITMAPFAIVAPILGPLLDRFRRGRRTALAITMLARAILALIVGHALSSDDPSPTQALTLYPAALGVLVCSKAYGIVRSAAVPRLVPESMTLVQANSRLTLAGVIAPAAAGSVAAAVVATLGHRTELLLGAVVYVIAAIMAWRLPAAADGADEPAVARKRTTGGLIPLDLVGRPVRDALRSAASLRWLSGFMLFFGAFVVRVHPFHGISPTICLGSLAIGIGVGNVLGTTLGPRTASIAARRLSVILLAATTGMCVVVAFDYALITVFAMAIVAAAAAAVSKLALDATIQREIADDVRTSVFARSETTLQLAWVIGGGVGILLPARAVIGFPVAAAVLGFALAIALGYRPKRPPKRGAGAAAA
ncbi:MAG: MFS transporter [Frankiaceae bacterium]|nr:MFS transporter [Frankiaceae bacterium]